MSWRYKGGFIQEFFNPLTAGPLDTFPLYSWGYNNVGQLGQNDLADRWSPVQVGSQINWSNVVASRDTSAAIKTDGTLWTWGGNGFGQLGQNDAVSRSSPVQVGALTNWSALPSTLWYSATTIKKTDGTLWSWGYNFYGQLGQNISYIINRSSPVQIGSQNTWSNVASGQDHTLATKTDGTLWSWGRNFAGQLGQNISYIINRSSPVQIGTDTTWSKVSCGQTSSLATKTDGTLWSWGANGNGQLGLNDNINRSTPAQIGVLTTWSIIGCGVNSTFAIKTNGTLWAWGRNNAGQLGDNTVTTKSSPVQVGSLTTWLKVSGGYNNVSAIKTDGTLWTWGYNFYGQLGQNDQNNRSSPVQVGSLTNWSVVGSSYYSVLATTAS